VVEDRRFERLGGAESVTLGARIVASASADLEQAVDRGLFRRDLFHRLGVFLVRLPPLRERTRDIAPLTSFFLGALGQLGSAEREPERRTRVPLRFSADAIEALEAYSWPGNVRELKAVVEHGALVSRTDAVERTDLPAYVLDGPRRGLGSGKSERMTLEELEKSYIERVLREVGGNQTKAAEILGISRKSLWERRRRYGLG
jgi:DNA-binding NtrC family response regulator